MVANSNTFPSHGSKTHIVNTVMLGGARFTFNQLALMDLENEAKESDHAEEEIEIEDSSQPDLKKKGRSNLGDINYKTYTEEFDEIIKAEDLENDEELTRLRKNLDQQLLQLKNFISKLANKLQRKLLAKQNRSWNFDLEEGLLDTSKLPRIIMDPFNSLTFKKEKDIEFKKKLFECNNKINDAYVNIMSSNVSIDSEDDSYEDADEVETSEDEDDTYEADREVVAEPEDDNTSEDTEEDNENSHDRRSK